MEELAEQYTSRLFKIDPLRRGDVTSLFLQAMKEVHNRAIEKAVEIAKNESNHIVIADDIGRLWGEFK